MANSSTHLDTISQSQQGKEVTANAFFDAASPATLYGRRAAASGGLTWGYFGGNVTVAAGTMSQIANGTLTLTASTTNYIVALKSSGAVSFSTATTNWNDTTNYWRLYSVVTGTATVTSYTDSRELGKMTGGAGSAASGTRETLTANRTYYVRTDGSDSNNGLANTSGGAFLTLQKAADIITETLDLASFTVTVQVGDGTYTAGVTLRKCTGRGGFSVAVLQGNSGSPSNVVVSTTGSNAILATANATEWLVKNLKVQTTTSGYGVYVSVNAYLSFENVVFGACASSQIYSAYGGTAAASGNYSITGGAPYHWSTAIGGRIVATGKTITLTGTPAYATGFAAAAQGGLVSCAGNTFSGSATGKRYTGIVSNGIVDTGGGGASYLPGNTAGDTPTSGGQYL